MKGKTFVVVLVTLITLSLTMIGGMIGYASYLTEKTEAAQRAWDKKHKLCMFDSMEKRGMKWKEATMRCGMLSGQYRPRLKP